MKKVFIVIAAILGVNFHMSDSFDCAPYDSIDGEAIHTMCLYEEGSGCKKIARGITQVGIDEIITTHNTLRQKVANGQEDQPSASNMKQLKWNNELATIAQRWADQCIFGSDGNRNTKNFSYVGQNLATTNRNRNTDSLAGFKNVIIDVWYSQVSQFNPDQIEQFLFSPDTGGYTQVVWAESTDVGCGYTYYLSDARYTKFYVCNYGPGGNILDESVYKQGPPCTECDNGCSTTYPGLCN